MTYSIIARDSESGQLGVAVQSHWFSVGQIVPWAEPGVGAVATQSIAEPAYGPGALARLKRGESAHDALATLLAGDTAAAYRQVAIVDSQGRVAVHTGEACIVHAGATLGEGFSAQANMMRTSTVWDAMGRAFADAPRDEPLAERLLRALDAGEAAGGDVRGRQSASVLVVGRTGEPWRREVDLRVEDHTDPLGELRRLLVLHRAYELATLGDELVGAGRHAEAGEQYARASELAPGNDELLFWAGLARAQAGDLDGAEARVREAIGRNEGWAALLERLGPDIAPGAEAVRERLRH